MFLTQSNNPEITAVQETECVPPASAGTLPLPLLATKLAVGLALAATGFGALLTFSRIARSRSAWQSGPTKLRSANATVNTSLFFPHQPQIPSATFSNVTFEAAPLLLLPQPANAAPATASTATTRETRRTCPTS